VSASGESEGRGKAWALRRQLWVEWAGGHDLAMKHVENGGFTTEK